MEPVSRSRPYSRWRSLTAVVVHGWSQIICRRIKIHVIYNCIMRTCNCKLTDHKPHSWNVTVNNILRQIAINCCIIISSSSSSLLLLAHKPELSDDWTTALVKSDRLDWTRSRRKLRRRQWVEWWPASPAHIYHRPSCEHDPSLHPRPSPWGLHRQPGPCGPTSSPCHLLVLQAMTLSRTVRNVQLFIICMPSPTHANVNILFTAYSTTYSLLSASFNFTECHCNALCPLFFQPPITTHLLATGHYLSHCIYRPTSEVYWARKEFRIGTVSIFCIRKE